jgi:competence protein ComFC
MVNINPIAIRGNWTEGFALDLHSQSSECLGDDEFGHTHFATLRSEMGELLFRLKYRFDKSSITPIVDTVVKFITNEWKISGRIDMVIPVPPSDTSRNFQPVTELAKEIAEKLGVSVSSAIIKIAQRLKSKI